MTEQDHPGLRDRRRRETTQAIQEAALDLFEERGFDATTVPDIAERAGVSTRTFFRYVDSKESAALPAQRRLEADIATFTPAASDLPGIAAEVLDLMRTASTGVDDTTQEQHERIARLFQTTPHLHAAAAARDAILAQMLHQKIMSTSPTAATEEVRLLIEMVSAVWRTSWWHWGFELSRERGNVPAHSFDNIRSVFATISPSLMGAP